MAPVFSASNDVITHWLAILNQVIYSHDYLVCSSMEEGPFFTPIASTNCRYYNSMVFTNQHLDPFSLYNHKLINTGWLFSN